ncbi:phasin family protein [Sphingomonas naphthae]|uniref:Phasin family protein n=1 Tax=Sphingomonas naphthae TaxID=1813468 RepID=A0ABY7TNX3_9SPHN|nr:phasin family protein [Sphingomonas naphthae]WCT74095.1 phasin family protein [Sphingomonas naphthae]
MKAAPAAAKAVAEKTATKATEAVKPVAETVAKAAPVAAKAPVVAAKAATKAVEAGADTVKKTNDAVADAAVSSVKAAAKAAETTSSTVTDATTKAVAAAETAKAEAQPPVTAPIVTSPVETPAAAEAADRLKGLFPMATAPAFFTEFNDRAKTAFEKSSKVGEELVEFSKGNVEALVASARVAAKGSEALAQEAAEYGKKSFETATTAFKGFAAVKSPTELFQLQSDYAKTSFDSAVAEASKLSEGMLKLMGDMFQPLSSRYAVATEKFKATAL